MNMKQQFVISFILLIASILGLMYCFSALDKDWQMNKKAVPVEAKILNAYKLSCGKAPRKCNYIDFQFYSVGGASHVKKEYQVRSLDDWIKLRKNSDALKFEAALIEAPVFNPFLKDKWDARIVGKKESMQYYFMILFLMLVSLLSLLILSVPIKKYCFRRVSE